MITINESVYFVMIEILNAGLKNGNLSIQDHKKRMQNFLESYQDKEGKFNG